MDSMGHAVLSYCRTSSDRSTEQGRHQTLTCCAVLVTHPQAEALMQKVGFLKHIHAEQEPGGEDGHAARQAAGTGLHRQTLPHRQPCWPALPGALQPSASLASLCLALWCHVTTDSPVVWSCSTVHANMLWHKGPVLEASYSVNPIKLVSGS